MNDNYLPYGIFDLDPQIYADRGPPLRIKCFVRGCDQLLQPPTRGFRGDVCRQHKIRCHASGTYTYPNVRHNIIVAKELLATRIIHHPFKFESHRLGYEKSEDAVTFNLFRSFQEAGCLNYIGRYITGLDAEDEPRLFLWGLELTDDSLTPLDLLIAARTRFETRLPVRRPATEPDAIILLDGVYLILVEAKLTSPNPYYTDGPRKNGQSLTKDELLNTYADLSLQMLDRQKAAEADRVYYQLWRNLVFAEWMALAAEHGTQPYLANLTCWGHENDSFNHFAQMVRPEFAGHLCHLYWEDLYVLAGLKLQRLSLLQQYLLTKTANLRPAFHFSY